MPKAPVTIDPTAPANPTQIVVMRSNDIQRQLVEAARPRGRPQLARIDFEDELLDRLRCGQSLLSVCRELHMPSYAWCQTLAERDPDFADRLDRARARGMEALIDLQIDIASGGEFSTGETMRDRELISTIRWTAAKRNSGKFGDKISAEGGVIIIARPPSDDGLSGFLE